MFKYHEDSDRLKKTPKPPKTPTTTKKTTAAQIFENMCVKLSLTNHPVHGLGSIFCIMKLLDLVNLSHILYTEF